MLNRFLLAFLGVFILISACKKSEITDFEPVVLDKSAYSLQLTNNTLPNPSLPSDNPLTIQKVLLGKMLFFERRMSLDNSVSCATCHRQPDGFSDPSRFSVGVQGGTGDRQAMPIFNLAWHSNGFFWDGRALTLREQSIQPIENVLEMKETMPNVINKLRAMPNFTNQFIRAFGSNDITIERISLALENYMFSIVSDDSKYDRYLAGTASLTASEERGRVLFFGEYNPFFPDVSGADCAHCHSSNTFENDFYMNNGLDLETDQIDLGRQKVTNNTSDRAKFKVPSLRNIQVTAPYMHDGRFSSLEQVIDHYNQGVKNSSTVDPALLGTTSTGLMLDAQEKIDLINFLKTLSDYTFLNNPAYRP